MAVTGVEPATIRLTPVQWLICGIAAIGFAFDIYEILMLPLIVRLALLELTGAAPGSPEFQMWVGRLFYLPAIAGGIVGLVGWYLTDLFGRRRVRLHLRGTGESFAANIGGRLIGTSFAWLTATLATTADRAEAPATVAMVAAAVGFCVYLAGFAASFWLPEPPTRELDHEGPRR